MMDEKKYWVGFNLIKGIGAVRMQALLQYFGGLEAAWKAGPADLAAAGLSLKLIERIVKARTQVDLDMVWAKIEAQGIKILGTQTFAKPDRDYNAQLTALKALNPDILMVSALAENAAGIVTQARQLGWNAPVMGGNGFNSPAFIKNAGPAAEGVYVGTAWNKVSQDPANQAFLKLMQSKGVDPDQF